MATSAAVHGPMPGRAVRRRRASSGAMPTVSSRRAAYQHARRIVSARFRSTLARWNVHDGVAARTVGGGGTNSDAAAGPGRARRGCAPGGRRSAGPPCRRPSARGCSGRAPPSPPPTGRCAARGAGGGARPPSPAPGSKPSSASSAPTRAGKASSAHSAPGPHARMVTVASAAETRRWVVAGPAGVRVARHTPVGSNLTDGSSRPRRSGNRVSRRSTGRAGVIGALPHGSCSDFVSRYASRPWRPSSRP